MSTLTTEQQATRNEFATIRDRLNDKFRVTLRFRRRVIGGVPAVGIDPENGDKDRNLLEVWLRKNLADKMTDEQIEEQVELTYDEAYKDTEEEATTTFKSDEFGIYIEGRQVKAMLKEVGKRLGFGKAVAGKRKSLRQDLHEALHIDEDAIYLMRDSACLQAPDGYEVRPVQVMTAMGPRTAIKKSAFVERAEVEFTVRILNMVELKEKHLKQILAHSQDQALGADRSQGFGKFEVIEFEAIS